MSLFSSRRAFSIPLAVALCALAAAPLRAGESLQGVVEGRTRKWIIVDSARVAMMDDARVSGDAREPGDIRVGDWAEVSGDWNDRGIFKARRIKIEREAPGNSFADNLKERSAREASKLQASDKIYKDEAVSAYVSRVGNELVPDYARKDFSFSFTVINDPSLNAFALPSGSIFVHTGLLAKMDNEAQLATVLGHEISHVTQLHGQRQYKKMIAFMIPAQIGALVIGTKVQQRTDSPVLQAMTALGLNLGMMAAVNGYGRTLEDQADRVGLRYAVGRGYDPRQAPLVWDTFNDVYGEEGKVENFLYSNHSTNDARKENLQDEIELHYRHRLPGSRAANAPDSESPLFDLMVGDDYQEKMIDVIRMTAVADFDLERYRISRKGFARVLEHRPGDPVAIHYKGRILLATEEGASVRERARRYFLEAIEKDPAYAEPHRDLGILYRDMNRNREARIHLQKYLEMSPGDDKEHEAIRKALRKME